MSRTGPARLSPLLGLLVLLLGLSSCSHLLGGKAEIRQKRRFTFVVERLQLNLQDSARPYQATVQLQTFDIAGAYSLSEIVSRRSAYELRRDPLHVWGQRPRDMITDIVGQYLRNAQLFTRLATERDLLDQRPDYILSGTIRALERFDSGDRWFARLVMSMQLVDVSGRVVWRGEIKPTDEIEVFNADMQYTVQAMSEILRRRMGEFIRQIDLLFLNLQRQPGAPELSAYLQDSTQVTQVDTAAASVVPDYYELIPGKLAPE